CPTCGMKLTRDDLSICSYCSAPLNLGAEQAKLTETMKRLGKMTEHKNYETAMAFAPPESREYQRGIGDQRRGRSLFGVAGALLLLSLISFGVGGPGVLLLVLAALSAGSGFWLGQRGKARCVEATSQPLLRRPALVRERRSETDFVGGRGETIYYFQLEFVDGGTGEFRAPGKGAAHEPLVNGNTGIAYSRGQTLLAFKILKV
ncbi:MAG: hypothetical protein AAF368_04765, partial [Planctomycetota bacterium]